MLIISVNIEAQFGSFVIFFMNFTFHVFYIAFLPSFRYVWDVLYSSSSLDRHRCPYILFLDSVLYEKLL